MDNKLRKQLFEQRTKEWDDYYNRSSIQSSYTIAIIGAIGCVIVIIATLVAEVV